MTTITHIASGQTLTGEVVDRGQFWFGLRLTGSEGAEAFKVKEWRIEPEPRTLPTHVGAMVMGPDVSMVWRLPSGKFWVDPYGMSRTPTELLLMLGPNWVELVPKSDTPPVDREAVIAETVAAVAISVNNNCSPSSEEYAWGGDSLIGAVAKWIGSPPEFVSAEWARVVRAEWARVVRAEGEAQA